MATRKKPAVPPDIQREYDKLVRRFPGPWRRPRCYRGFGDWGFSFGAGALVTGPYEDRARRWYASGADVEAWGRTAVAAFTALQRGVASATRKQLRDASCRVFKARMAVGLDGVPDDLARVGPEKPMGYFGTRSWEEALAWVEDAKRRDLCVRLVQFPLPGDPTWWVHAWDDAALSALLQANEALVLGMLRGREAIATQRFGELVGAVYFDPSTHPKEHALIKQCFGGADEGWDRDATETDDSDDNDESED